MFPGYVHSTGLRDVPLCFLHPQFNSFLAFHTNTAHFLILTQATSNPCSSFAGVPAPVGNIAGSHLSDDGGREAARHGDGVNALLEAA